MSENEQGSGPGIATRGHEIMLLSASLYIILFCISGILIFTRIRLRSPLDANGILVLLAMIPTSLYFVATLLTNDDFKWNRHQFDIPSSTLIHGFKMVFATEIMFTAALTLAKLSLMLLVRRIMSSTSSFWRGLTVCATILVAIQGIVSLFLVVFQYQDPQNFWSTSTTSQQDLSASSTLLASGIFNTITDFFTLLLPIPSVLSFQISRRQKAVLIFMFLLGFCSIGAGISRTYFISQASIARSTDFTWPYYPVWITSAVQLYPGMLCALLPPSTKFFTTYLPSLFPPSPSPFSMHSSEADRPPSSYQYQQRNQSIFGGNMSSGEEELLDFEKIVSASGSGSGSGSVGVGVGGSANGNGVTMSTVESRSGVPLSEEDSEFIKITQQTVVQVSRASEV